MYREGGVSYLIRFTDSDYVRDMEDSKVLHAMCIRVRSNSLVLSTTEAKFIVASVCACQAVWMRRIGHSQIEGICDNTSTIKLSKNPALHRCFKHIRVRFHFLRDLTKEGAVNLLFCGTRNPTC